MKNPILILFFICAISALPFSISANDSKNSCSQFLESSEAQPDSALSLNQDYSLEVAVVKHLYASGVDLSTLKIKSDKSKTTSDLIAKITGKSQTGAAFYALTRKLGIKWGELLAKAEIDTKQVFKKVYKLSLVETASVIKFLYDNGRKVSTEEIKWDTTDETANLIEKSSGRRQTGSGFYQMSLAQGYKWPDLIRQAGLDPKNIIQNGFGLTFEEAVSVIKSLSQNNISVRAIHLEKDRSPETAQVINEILGREQTGSGFREMVKKNNFIWNDLLSAAGLVPGEVNDRKYILTLESIIKVIQILHYNKIKLNVGSIRVDQSESTAIIIEKVLGRKISGTGFYRRVVRAGFDWNEILNAAGLDIQKIKKTKFGLSFEDVVSATKYLNQSGISVNADSINNDKSELTAELIYNVTGRWQNGSALYKMAIRKEKMIWATVLSSAGLTKVQAKVKNQKLTFEQCVDVLKNLSTMKVAFQAEQFSHNTSDLVADQIKKITGTRQLGAVFYKMTQDQGYSWIELLEAAGLSRSSEISDKKIIAVILALYDYGVPINAKALAMDRSLTTQQVIHSKLGYPMLGSAFYQRVTKGQRVWSDLLSLAGFDPRSIKLKDIKLTSDEIVRVLQKLNEENIPINSFGLKMDLSVKTEGIIKSVLGFSMTGSGFYSRVTKGYKNKSWDDWITEAGFDIRNVKLLDIKLTVHEIVKVIQKLHEAKISINQFAISNDRELATADKIKSILSFTMTGAGFYSRVINGYKDKSWDDWLALSGLDPRSIRLTNIVLTPDEVIKVIQKLYDEGISINFGSIATDYDSQTTNAIESVLGFSMTGSGFHKRVLNYDQSKSWDDWIVDAGFDPRSIRLNGIKLNFDEIIKVIQKLLKDEIQLNMASISVDTSLETTKAIESVLGFSMTGASFYNRIKNHYSDRSWDDWLSSAGFDPRSIKRNYIKLSPDEIIKVIQALHKDEIAINYSSIISDDTAETADLIESILGFSITGASFYNRVLNHETGKTWDAWIKDAGLDPRSIKLRDIKLTSGEAIKIIQKLNEAKVSLNYASMAYENDVNVTDIIKSVLGFSMTGARFYARVLSIDESRSWDDWIRASGLDPRSVKLNRIKLTPSEGIEVIKKLYIEGVPLNSAAIGNDYSEQTAQIIKNVLGFPMKGFSFHRRLVSQKHWALWLSSAGLDVTQIQLKGKIPYKLVNGITKASLRKMESNRSAILGDSKAAFQTLSDDQWEAIQVDENDGESALIKKEFDDAFESFSDGLTNDEQKFMQGLIDSLEQGHELSEAISQLAFVYGPETKMIIQNLFEKIKENPMFIELLTAGRN